MRDFGDRRLVVFDKFYLYRTFRHSKPTLVSDSLHVIHFQVTLVPVGNGYDDMP